MTTKAPTADRGAIAFAEKLLALLDRGAFTSTYKYAVLLGLIDLCLEGVTRTGAAPQSVTTAQLARKVLELYWPHTAPYGDEARLVLRQNHGPRGSSGGQAKIVQHIVAYRARHAPDPSAPLMRAEAHAPAAFARLLRQVEWSLVQMPLPRLQRMGRIEGRFIYEIGWDESIRRGEFNDPRQFANTIHFVGDAAEHLVRLAGLLRPLIQREWAMMIAQLNRAVVPDAQLEEFLFGAQRVDLSPVRSDLRELQDNRCFYCRARLRHEVHVDHFIPWARHPNNSIENLVITDARCNSAKSDHLAAADHVQTWSSWLHSQQRAHADIARRVAWSHEVSRSLGVARAIYLRLPADVLLWRQQRDFVPAERALLQSALASP